MIATKMSNIQSMATQLMPNAELNKVVEAINQAWRRRVKADEAEMGKTSLGKFDRSREDLTTNEVDFVLDWFKGKTDVDLTPQPVDVEAISKAVEKEQRRLKTVFDQQLKTDTEAALNAERERLALIHQAEKAQAIEAEKTRMRSEFDAKFDAERARLEKSVIGNSDKQIMSEKRHAEAEAKAAIAEERAKLTTEFENKVQLRIEKDRTERAVVWHKEKGELLSSFELENNRLNTLLTEQIEAKRVAHQVAEKAKNEAAATIKQLELERQKRAWRQRIPSVYDIVNFTSNALGFFGFINLFGSMGAVISVLLICFFWGIVQDLKKVHRTHAAWFGICAAIVIEIVYGYIHNTFFMDLLQTKKHLGVQYFYVANAFAIIVSGASVYAALMTRLRTQDDAEAKRCDDIDAALKQ